MQRRWSRLRESGGAALGFLALSLAFCYPVGLSTGMLDADGDGVRSYLPFLVRAFWPVDASVAGAWDPTLFTGLPESHTPFGRYYPPTILLHMFFGPTRALALGVVLHHAWAGLGAYLLARLGGLSRSAAWLAGICFAFGGFMVFHRGHPPMHQAAAWLSWVLAAFELFRTRGTVAWIAVTGTLLTLLALPGHPQMIVLGGVVWLTYLLYFTWIGPGDRCSRGRFVLGVAVALIIGALGSLPAVLPVAEVAKWSGYRNADPGFVADGHLKIRFLAGLAGPWILGDGFGATRPHDYLGVSEQGVFYGVLPLAVAVVAIVGLFMSWRSRRLARAQAGPPPTNLLHPPWPDPNHLAAPTDPPVGFWVILLVESLVLMLSKSLGIHDALAHLPVYNLFHIPARHVWVFGLALGWLAGFGLDRLRQADPLTRARLLKWTAWSFVALGVACLAVVLGMPSWSGRPGWSYPGFWIPLVSGVAVLSALAALSRALPKRRGLAALVSVFAFVELWLSIGRHETTTTRPDVLTRLDHFPEVVRWLRGQAADGAPPRCLIRKETWEADGHAWHVPSAFGSAWGLSALSAYSQAMPDSLAALLHLNSFGHADLGAVLTEERGLSAVGGRHIVAAGPLSPMAPGFGYRIATLNDLVWKVNARTPNRHSEFIVSNPACAARSPVAQLPGAMGPSYFVQGELRCAGPRQGRVRIVRTNRRGSEILAEATFAPGDFKAGRQQFACTYDLGKIPGMFWLAVECTDELPIDLVHVDLWRLTPEFGEKANQLDPREVARTLRRQTRQPYPVVASFSNGVCVYENPRARGLATLVREVRPAANLLDAARRILSPGPPVRELAFVVAPDGRVGNAALTGPLHFAPGEAVVESYKPDEIHVRTSTPGNGFLVLGVTRCIGWSASVDGEALPICAVDGPLMGVSIPAGDHMVRFHFRPLLAWAGITAAGLGLGGAWLGVLLAFVVRAARSKRGARPALPGDPDTDDGPNTASAA
jgi:hypothetical protein